MQEAPVALPVPVAASSQAIVEILRGFLDLAFAEQVTSLKIDAIVSGQHRGVTINVK